MSEPSPKPGASSQHVFDAIAFDLLTALIDSWTLWGKVAGDETKGREWRSASLRLVTAAGNYQPYEDLVRRATREVGLPRERAEELLERWDELEPWPEAPGVLDQLRGRRLAVVTNCSQKLAERAAAKTGGEFELILSAERAGAYKIDPRPYRRAAELLGVPPGRVLFVAGSAHDVPGAMRVGMPVFWSNRDRLPVPDPPPLVDAPDLTGLTDFVRRQNT